MRRRRPTRRARMTPTEQRLPPTNRRPLPWKDEMRLCLSSALSMAGRGVHPYIKHMCTVVVQRARVRTHTKRHMALDMVDHKQWWSIVALYFVA